MRHLRAKKRNHEGEEHSGYPGVFKKGSKWKAILRFAGERYELGTFITIGEAITALEVKKEELLKEAKNVAL